MKNKVYDIIMEAHNIASIPVLCKNGSYADSATGRRLVSEEAIEGKITFVQGSKQYVNQKLKKPIYSECTWYSNRKIYYVVLKAEKINKHGLLWQEEFMAVMTPYDMVPHCTGNGDMRYWLYEFSDENFIFNGSGTLMKTVISSIKNSTDDINVVNSEQILHKFKSILIGSDESKNIDLEFWTGKYVHDCIFYNSQRDNLKDWLKGVYKEKYEELIYNHGIKKRKFGFELEFTGISRDTAARVVGSVLNATKSYVGGPYNTHTIRDKLNREWRIVRDASIVPSVTANRVNPNKEHYKCELVSPILEYKDLSVITKIVAALKRKGAAVNISCGMHVHVDINEFDAIMLRNLVNITVGKEDLMLKALSVNNYRVSRWCKKIDFNFCHDINQLGRRISINDIKKAWYKGYYSYAHYNPTRYHILNLHSYFENKGIEFRLFNSTIEAKEVKANIIFSVAICCLAAVQSKSVNHYARRRTAKHTGNKDEMSSWLYKLGLKGNEFKYLRAYFKRFLTNDIREVA